MLTLLRGYSPVGEGISPRILGQPLLRRAVSVHLVDLGDTVAGALEDYLLAVRREGGIALDPRALGEVGLVGAVRVHNEDVRVARAVAQFVQ